MRVVDDDHVGSCPPNVTEVTYEIVMNPVLPLSIRTLATAKLATGIPWMASSLMCSFFGGLVARFAMLTSTVSLSKRVVTMLSPSMVRLRGRDRPDS